MSDHSPSNACPKCGAALPSAATSGLCPRCLMAEAMLPTQADAAPAAGVKILTPEQLAPHFPQLEILECLGRGGMGVVYKARQKSLDRLVALKLLAPERAHDAGFAERFAREAQALAALNHPHIVTVHDFGVVDAVAPRNGDAAENAPVPHAKMFFLLMEFVDGVNLRQAMKAGRFTPEQALAVVPPVCEALQYAHEHGIVHRDIKPENLLLDKEGRVKIADFGIAKILGAPVSELTAGDGEPNSPNQSSALHEPTLASVAGTPQYMAPEQKAHRATDHRADIYSLGVVLYELLTGELPADKLQPPSKRVQVDVRLDEIVLRALEKSPELRYQTAVEFRTQVESVAAPGGLVPESEKFAKPPKNAIWKLLVLEVAGIAIIATLGAWCWLHHTAGTANLVSGITGMIVAVVFWIMGVPLALRLSPRNAIYGIRVRESFESESRWYEINEYGGRQCMLCGVLTTAFSAVMFFSLTPANPMAKSLCIAFAVLIPMAASIWWAKETHPRVPNPQKKQILIMEIIFLIFLVWQSAGLFVCRSFEVRTDELAPTSPNGTKTTLWKIGRPAAGEAVTFEHEGRSLLGRVLAVKDDKLTVKRNGTELMDVHMDSVTGRIVLGPDGNVYTGTTTITPPSSPQATGTFTLSAPSNASTGTTSQTQIPSITLGSSGTAAFTLQPPANATVTFNSGHVNGGTSALAPGMTGSGTLSQNPNQYTGATTITAPQVNATTVAIPPQAKTPEERRAVLAAGYLQQGDNFCRQDRYAEAAASCREAVELTPKDPHAWTRLGMAEFHSSKVDDAEKAFQKALALNPNWTEALNGLGILYFDQSKFEKAEPLLLKSAELAEDSPWDAWSGLSRFYMLQGKFEDAEKWAQKIVSLGIGAPVAQKMLEAAKAKKLGEELHKEIEPMLAKPATPKPANAAALSQEGWRLWNAGKFAEAIPKFQEVVKLAPGDASAWNGLGWAQFKSGKSDEAEKTFQKTVALDPNAGGALNGLGQIRLAERKYGEAEQWLVKAAGQNASAAWHALARIYLLQGKFEDAEKWAQMLDDSGQGDAISKKMLEAAKAKKLSDGLRATIEPPEPASK